MHDAWIRVYLRISAGEDMHELWHVHVWVHVHDAWIRVYLLHAFMHERWHMHVCMHVHDAWIRVYLCINAGEDMHSHAPTSPAPLPPKSALTASL